MIARSFQGDIKIGQMLQGAVVAVGTDGSTDPLDGTIDSIEVGFPLHPYADGPNPNDEGGFQGTFKTTLDAPMNGPGVREIWYGGAPGYDTERAKDSVIRAYTSIGSVRITKMSNGLVRTSGNPGLLRPRVESPYVSSILIDELESGSVWSGTLIEYPASPFDNITYNYASVGILSIGCVGPAADLWLQGTPLIEVTSALAGEIHVPSLASGQTIRVGEQFLDVAGIESPIDPQSVPCGRFDGGWHIGEIFGYDQNALEYEGFSNEEPTPRSVWDQHSDVPYVNIVESNTTFDAITNNANRGVAAYGRILIREPNGLRGQVIIDANNTGSQWRGTHWLGDVEIGTGAENAPNTDGTPKVISIDNTRATTIGSGNGEGPLYTALPGDFGNGAVGLVPFTVHGPACLPPHRAAPIILDSEMNNHIPNVTPHIDVEFYGPVTPINPSEPPVAVEYIAGSRKIDMTRFFAFEMNPADRNEAAPRVIRITRSSDANYSADVLAGEYRVVARLTDPLYTSPPPYNLYCDLGPGIAPVIVDRRFEYVFTLGADCDKNGLRDVDEIDDNASLDSDPANGVLDVCEAEPGDCAACAADFNSDGGIDGADLSAFFLAYEAGSDCADVDENGGVDGADLAAFFASYEAGGCD